MHAAARLADTITSRARGGAAREDWAAYVPMTIPPSTLSTAPVMKLASSEARK